MDEIGPVKGVILTADRTDRSACGPVDWDACPGLLLPLANTPLVDRILSKYARAGVRETLIAAGRDTGKIASLCGDGARWDMTLAYQDAARDAVGGQGPRGLIREVAAFTKDDPFLVTIGPLLLESEVYGRMVDAYSESRPCGIRAGHTTGDTSGSPGGAGGYTGVYLMTPRIFDALNCEDSLYDSPESLFDTALDALIRRGESVSHLDADQPPFGVRSPEAFLASNERLLASGLEASGSKYMETAMPEIMDDNFSSPNLVLHPPVMVDATAELERCRIGPGVCIGPRVRIGHGAAIEHSVIMTGADIGDGATISHAVIGENASIENRSVLHGRPDRVIVVRTA